MRAQQFWLDALVLGILVVIYAPVSMAFADNAAPMTKIESRELPTDEVKQRTLDQLSRILVLDPYPATETPPRLPLSDLWFWTRPRETYVSGLCATDSVTVNFRPSKLPLIGADTPTLAESIQAKTVYRFAVLPPAIQAKSRDWPLGEDNPDCVKLNPRVDPFFWARDEEDAVEGIWLVGEVERQAIKGSLSFALNCDFPSPYDGIRCVKDLGDLKQIDVSDIDRCEPAENENAECLKVWMRSQQITLKIFVKGEKIIRVIANEVVTTGDARAD